MNNSSETSSSYDSGNRRHVERREKAAKTARRQRDEAVRWLMGDARGRRVMWDLLAKAGVFHSSMAASAELTAFNEGRRDIGLGVLADIMRLCPQHYATMQAEANCQPPNDQPPRGGDDKKDEDDNG